MRTNATERADPTTEQPGVDKTDPSSNGFRFTLLVLIALAIVINARIIMSPGLPVHGDLTFPTSIDNFLDSYLYTFNEHGSISNLESIDRALIFMPLGFAAKVLGLGTSFVHKFSFVALTLTSLITMAFLLRYLLSRIDPRLIRPGVMLPASIVYAFSPWALEQLPALLFWAAYALTPLLVHMTLRFLEEPDPSKAFWLGVILSFIASTPHYLAYSLVIMSAIALAMLARPRTRRGRAGVRRLMMNVAIFAGVFLAFNLYWLLPTMRILLSGRAITPGYAVDASMTHLFSVNASPLNVLRGQDQWINWYANDDHLNLILDNLWVANSLVLPATAFLLFLQKNIRKSRPIALLALLGMASGLLAMGTATPIYNWLVFEIPVVRNFGWLLRVPGKLSYPLWLFYALMTALMIGYLAQHIGRGTLRIALRAGLAVSLIALLAPKSIAYFYHYFVPVKIPAAYEELERRLAQDDDLVRTLYLAPYDFAFGENSLGYETSYTWNPSRLAAASPAMSSPNPSIGYYHLTYRDWQNTLYPNFYPRIPKDLGQSLLREAGVRYLAYHNDIVGATDRGERDIRRLNRSDLDALSTFGDIHLYENPTALPFVRGEFRGSFIDDVEVRKVNPAMFEVTIPEGTSIDSLVLAQPFDPLWVLETSGETYSGEPMSAVTTRFEVPRGTNHMSLEYLPQDLYQKGLKVSGTAIVTAFLLLAARRMFLRYQRRGRGSQN